MPAGPTIALMWLDERAVPSVTAADTDEVAVPTAALTETADPSNAGDAPTADGPFDGPWPEDIGGPAVDDGPGEGASGSGTGRGAGDSPGASSDPSDESDEGEEQPRPPSPPAATPPTTLDWRPAAPGTDPVWGPPTVNLDPKATLKPSADGATLVWRPVTQPAPDVQVKPIVRVLGQGLGGLSFSGTTFGAGDTTISIVVPKDAPKPSNELAASIQTGILNAMQSKYNDILQAQNNFT